ncbi:hypothetical protein A3Q56_01212 [Intoshia linei]|uniref:Uncharacterized protein n=1 Tax=Intoshia linei TaxID=1819745 RepID=A0A177BBT1_9BILA|nr:hypothetical protein A3Q56_01212 [Intoshia linei]
MKQKINLQLAHNPVVTCQLLDQPTDLSFPNNLKKENFDSQFKISQKRSSNHSIDVLLKNESDKNGIWDKKSFKINGVDQIDFSDNISPKLAILIDKIFEKCDNDANQKNTNQEKTDNYLFNLKYAGKIVCQLSKNESDFKEKYVIDTSKVLNIENNTSNTLCDKCKGVIFNFHNMCSKCGVYICFKCSNVLSQLQNRPGKLFCYRHQEICIPKVVYTYGRFIIISVFLNEVIY